MYTSTIEIANIRCLIKSEEISLIKLAKAQYEGFISQGEPDIEIQIYNNLNRDKYRALARASPRPNHSHVNIVPKGAKVFFARSDFAGYINMKNRRGEATLSSLSAVGLDSCLRICYSLVAVVYGGFLLHSAGVAIGEKGYIFYGPSESGKTTITRLAPPSSTILSDELTLIRRLNGFYRAFGTPFYGDLSRSGTNVSVQAESLFLLKKDKKAYLQRLRYTEALSVLLSNVFFFTAEFNMTKRLFSLCCDLCTTIPIYELHFSPDGTFWRHINGIT